MSQIILYIMAAGAILGGMDYILGNRLGFGCRFEEAFRMLGSIALSMAGILCLAPVLSDLLGLAAAPLFTAVGLDPGMLGSLLAIDMGGYQMAMELALDPAVGRFSGIIVSAIFGCTLVFTIPVGLGAVAEADRPFFTRGILLGMAAMPAGLLPGGLLCGLSLKAALWNCLPIFLLSGGLILGLTRKPEATIRLFQKFSKGLQMLAGFGLMIGAVEFMTGHAILPKALPLEQAMETVCSIAIVMLGSMPLAELLQRLLRRPFQWIGTHTGMNSASTTGILIGMVSIMPALAMLQRMDRRGKIVNGAFAVCAASAFAAHLGFALSAEPELAGPLLTAKLLGGVCGILIALAATAREQ